MDPLSVRNLARAGQEVANDRCAGPLCPI